MRYRIDWVDSPWISNAFSYNLKKAPKSPAHPDNMVHSRKNASPATGNGYTLNLWGKFVHLSSVFF